mmetsp:Transcript_58622/g.85744  ORF Transcript_58622/g.85744 Transcript_58622/m.85744 type:complete len:89 (-) Transcript_58622:107-373(-)
MVPVTTKSVCEDPSCGKQPCWKFPRDEKLRFCTVHKIDGMAYHAHRIVCNEESCKKAANFNYPGISKKLFCSNHKKRRHDYGPPPSNM